MDWRKHRVKDDSGCLYLSNCGTTDEDREFEEGNWFDWRRGAWLGLDWKAYFS